MHLSAHRTKRIGRRFASATVVMLLLGPAPALACSVSVAPLVFGSIDPLQGADADSATSVSIDCGGAMSYSIALSTGSGTQLERVITRRQRAGYNSIPIPATT